MPIEQVLLIVPVAMLATGFMLWTRRTQRLASSSIIVTTSLAREQLEHLFFECIGRGGRDRCGVFDGHVASQPNHFRRTLALHFDLSHDEVGAPATEGSARIEELR